MAETPSLSRLVQIVQDRGDQDCIVRVYEGELERWSASEITSYARGLSSGLTRLGVGSGDVVMIWAPNSPAWIIMALAVGLAGGILMPIDEQALEDAPTVLKESGAKFVATDRNHARDLEAAGLPNAVTLILLDDDAGVGDDTERHQSWRGLLMNPPDVVPEIDPNAPAILTFTSGTTGMPKSFYLTHANLLLNARNIQDANIAEADDRALLPLPLHHAYPYVIGMLSPLMTGATIVLPQAATGPKIIEALRAANVTILLGVPRLYDALISGLDANLEKRPAPIRAVFRGLQSISASIQHRLGWAVGGVLLLPLRKAMAPDLRLMVSGGAPLDPHVNARLEALGWTVCSGYGLSETASVFTTNVPQARKVGSAGRVIGEGELRILDADEDGIGEITVKGPNVFSGYRDNPEANAEAFIDGEWFRTGDLGHLDKDEFLFITGRAKELIVLGGGKKINPENAEKIFLNSEVIAEVALLEHQGALVALVRPDLDEIRYRGSTQVKHAVGIALSETAQNLPAYARPSGFQISNEPLPRTRLGKLRRFMLPELYEELKRGHVQKPKIVLSQTDQELLRDPQVAEVLDLLKKKFPEQTLVPDTNLHLDLGVDSFAWMSLALELQEGMGVSLSEQQIAQIQTVRDLLDAVKDNRSGSGEETPSSVSDDVPLDAEYWLRPTGPLLTMLGIGVHKLMWLFMRFYFSLDVEGLEHLPDDGALIITPNHVSDLDPLVVAASLPTSRLQRTYWAGDLTRLFGSPMWRFFSRVAHIFPVDERRPSAAIEAATTVLRNGKTQVWFPEGWRSPDGELQRFMPGVGRVIEQTKVRAVPVLIEGAFEAMPRSRRWPKRHPIRVTFGEPVDPDALAKSGHGEKIEERIANGIRDRVARLAGKTLQEAA